MPSLKQQPSATPPADVKSSHATPMPSPVTPTPTPDKRKPEPDPPSSGPLDVPIPGANSRKEETIFLTAFEAASKNEAGNSQSPDDNDNA
ncbi:hypothetical protein QE152_g41213 [Popillia japonica]|uniref:Uncharacterized protein n=1 Tax=Popillia japonica TaxID=7064 RepID=A0AAW1H3X8_POPJA